LARKVLAARRVAGPYRGAESEATVVRDAKRIGFIVRTYDDRDRTEKLILVGLALRQLQRLRGEPGVGLDRDPVPVEVIAVGDLPVDRDASGRCRLRARAS